MQPICQVQQQPWQMPLGGAVAACNYGSSSSQQSAVVQQPEQQLNGHWLQSAIPELASKPAPSTCVNFDAFSDEDEEENDEEATTRAPGTQPRPRDGSNTNGCTTPPVATTADNSVDGKSFFKTPTNDSSDGSSDVFGPRFRVNPQDMMAGQGLPPRMGLNKEQEKHVGAWMKQAFQELVNREDIKDRRLEEGAFTVERLEKNLKKKLAKVKESLKSRMEVMGESDGSSHHVVSGALSELQSLEVRTGAALSELRHRARPVKEDTGLRKAIQDGIVRQKGPSSTCSTDLDKASTLSRSSTISAKTSSSAGRSSRASQPGIDNTMLLEMMNSMNELKDSVKSQQSVMAAQAAELDNLRRQLQESKQQQQPQQPQQPQPRTIRPRSRPLTPRRGRSPSRCY
jgi:hypothetical protein